MTVDDKWISLVLEVAGLLVAVALVWQRLVSKVNGLGARVKRSEENCSKMDGRLSELSEEMRAQRQDSTGIYERLGRIERANEAISEQNVEMKVELAGHLGEIKLMIQEKDSKTRERLARIEARSNIPPLEE